MRRGWGTSWWARAALVVAAAVAAVFIADAGAASNDGCDEGQACAAAVGDLTSALGVDGALIGMKAHAIAAGDVNGDGWIDVFVGTFADRPAAGYSFRGATGPSPDRLLLGGPGGFRLSEFFEGERGRTSGAAFADLDGDADLDLVILRQPRPGENSSARSLVMRNDGGRFSHGVNLDSSRGLRSVGVLDYNADGRLDLFLVEDRFADGTSIMMRNEGNFRFTNATVASGLPGDIHGLGVVAADLNGDTTTDLFIGGSNRLFLNFGGRFHEAAFDFPWTTYGDEDDVAGVSAGDVDNDGRLDLLVGHHYNSTLDQGRQVPVRLYLNRGNNVSGHPTFSDVTVESGLAAIPTKAPHVELVDLDADGRLDILTSASAANGAEPAIFMNQGGSPPRFSTPAGLGAAQYWVAGATFDADRNGTHDIFLAEWDAALGSRVFSGLPRAGSWLDVSIGNAGTAGVGATVEVYRSGMLGNAAGRIGVMPVTPSTGYGSGSVSVAHFGVGARSSVDVRIRMPNNGRVIERRGVGTNRVLSISAAEAGGPGDIGASAPSALAGGVSLHVYPRPAHAGAPWSHWGQGIVVSGGRFVSAIGDHLGADGNSYIYVYNPATRRLDQVGDVLSAVPHTPGLWGYGKVHAQMVQTSADSVVFATYWGSRDGLAYGGTYQGDYLLRLNLASNTITPLGVPIPGKGIPTLASHGGLVYGEAVDPVTDAGTFFVYNPSSRSLVRRIDSPDLDGFRAIGVTSGGTALLATATEQMLRYVPGSSSLSPAPGHLPGGWLRATTEPDASGTIYAVTRHEERFVAIEANGTIRDLGAAPDYVTSLALDGNRVLFVPGAHGDAPKYAAALMSFDTTTGDQEVVVELNPLSERDLGLTLGGSYSVAIDRAARRVFVQMNAGPNANDPWGDIVLAVVELDDIGTTAPPVSQFPPGYCGPGENPAPAPVEGSAAGYWVLERDGTVHAFAGPHHGDLGDRGGLPAGVEAVGLARTPSGAGYWIADSSGRVHAFGDAAHLGDVGGLALGGAIVGIAAHPTTPGYWLVGSDGGIFSYGAAQFHGSTGAMTLNAPVISMSASADGGGYWLVASDGGVFTFGNAVFHGSTGNLVLNAPVSSMAVKPDGSGYWLTATDGGVFSFDVGYHGSVPGMHLCDPPGTRDIEPTLTGNGYYALLDNSGIFTFGDAMFRGADPVAVVDPIELVVFG